MAQPDYVPLVPADRVRPARRLSLPGPWAQERPAELVTLRPPEGARFGATGPDLGFGLKLAKRVGERAVLAEGEHAEDVLAGCFACGTKRSSTFHRAPTIYDMEWAFGLWGFLHGAAADLVAYRRSVFAGAGHDYSRQRGVADLVPDQVVRMSPRDVQAGLADWSRWLRADATSGHGKA